MTRTETLKVIVAGLKAIQERAPIGTVNSNRGPMLARDVDVEGLRLSFVEGMSAPGEVYFRIDQPGQKGPRLTGYFSPYGKDAPGVHVMSWRRGPWEAVVMAHAPSASVLPFSDGASNDNGGRHMVTVPRDLLLTADLKGLSNLQAAASTLADFPDEVSHGSTKAIGEPFGISDFVTTHLLRMGDFRRLTRVPEGAEIASEPIHKAEED